MPTIKFPSDAPTEGPGAATVVVFTESGSVLSDFPAVGRVETDADDILGLAIEEHPPDRLTELIGKKRASIFHVIGVGKGTVTRADLATIARHRPRRLTLGHAGSDGVELPRGKRGFEEIDSLRKLEVSNAGFTDRQLRAVVTPNLKYLTLRNTRVTSKGLTKTDLQYLAGLELASAPEIGNDLFFLYGSRRLGSLTLSQVGLKDHNLDQIAERTPEVVTLDISHNPVGAARLHVLERLKGLLLLDLSHTEVDDGLVRSLLGLRGVSHLRLEGTAVTDATMGGLHRLLSLRDLRLAETDITDRGLATLVKAAPGLQRLDVSQTGVSPAGIDAVLDLEDLYWLDVSVDALDEAAINRLGAHPNLGTIGFRGPMSKEHADLIGHTVETIGGVKRW